MSIVQRGRAVEMWATATVTPQMLKTIQQGTVAYVLGVSQSVIGVWTKKGCPRNADKKKTYDLSAVVQWRIVQIKKEAEDQQQDMIGGRNSPHLERRRRIDADMAELKLAVRRGELIELTEIRGQLLNMANILRRSGDALRLQYGEGAQKILDDALVDFIDTLPRTLGDNGEKAGND